MSLVTPPNVAPADGALPAPAVAPPSPLEMAAAVVARWRTVALVATLVVAALVVPPLVLPRTYTATGSFVLQQRTRGASSLGGLAAQFGVQLPVGDASQSPQLYADLLSSPEIRGQAVDARYTYEVDGRPQTVKLADVLAPDISPPALQRDRAIRELAERMDVTVALKTGVVSVAVHTRSPVLSALVADTLLGRLSEFNLRNRKSQATAERQFLERRTREALASLREAEARMQSFLLSNREFRAQSSPAFELERMEREVSHRQQLYSTLSQSYEQARIEEVRDTPVMSVLEPPRIPARPDPRGLVVRGIGGAIGGVLLGILIAALRAYRAHLAAQDGPGYRALMGALGSRRRSGRREAPATGGPLGEAAWSASERSA